MRKYLVIAFLFAFVGVFGQTNDTTKYFKSVDYGWQYKRLKADSILQMPNGLIVNRTYHFFTASDTAAMLAPYAKITAIPSLTPYMKYSDSAAMLSPYAKSFQLGNKVNYSDTAGMLAGYYRASNPNGYITGSAIANKVNYSDTSAMLSPYAKTTNLPSLSGYAKYSDTAAMLSAYYNKTATDAKVNLKVNISDTANMLSGYVRTSNIPTSTTVVKYTDTASMLSPYARTANLPVITGKVNYTDTAAMLSPYAKTINIPSVTGKVNYTDTATMLSGYYRASNPNGYITGSAITGKVNYSDTAAMLTPYSRDYNVVHLAGTETISGAKTFTTYSSWTVGNTANRDSAPYQQSFYDGTNYRAYTSYDAVATKGYWGTSTGGLSIVSATSNATISVSNPSGLSITTTANALNLNSANNININPTSHLIIQSNGTEKARFYQTSGNFLLGYGSSPTDNGYKIDVNGTARIVGNLTTNVNSAILKTNSSGVVSAATASTDYLIPSDISGKVNYTDTATMLSAYYNKTAANALLATKQNSLGYTAANDASVVHLAGTEVLTGIKFFNGESVFYKPATFDSTNMNYGTLVLFNNSSVHPFQDFSGATSIVSVPFGLKMGFGTGATSQLNFPNISGMSYTYPSSSGTLALTSQIPTNNNQLTNGSGYLTSYTETDPVVKAINGIVKSNGTTISAATAGTDYVAPSALSSYLPLSGGTLTGGLNGTNASFSSSVFASNFYNYTGGFPSNIAAIFSANANAVPASTGSTANATSLRLRGGDNAVMDFGLNSTSEWIQSHDQSSLGTNYYLSLNPNGGNIGIGTLLPSYALDVKQSVNGNHAILVDNTYTSSASGTASVFLANAGNLKVRYDYARDLDAGIVGTIANIPMLFFQGNSEKMRLASNGNLLVSTTSSQDPVFKFQVGNGSADTRVLFKGNNPYSIGIGNGSADLWYQGVAAGTAGAAYQFYNNSSGLVTMTLTTTNNELLGTTTDNGNRLQVNGNIWSSQHITTGASSGFTSSQKDISGGLLVQGAGMAVSQNDDVFYPLISNYNIVAGSGYYNYPAFGFMRPTSNINGDAVISNRGDGLATVYWKFKPNGDFVMPGTMISNAIITNGSGTITFGNFYTGTVCSSCGTNYILEVTVNGTKKYIQLYGGIN